jgi:hypothetical protein
MRGASVLEEKDTLPGSKLHFAIDNRDCLTCARQGHADVRWHVIAAFRAMREVIGILRHETVEKLFQIAPGRRVGILHDDNAATGVLNKNSHSSVSHAAPLDLRLHIVGDFVGPFASSANFKSIMLNAHKFSDRKYHVVD